MAKLPTTIPILTNICAQNADGEGKSQNLMRNPIIKKGKKIMPNNLFRGKPVKPIDSDALPEYADYVKDGWVYGYLIGNDVIVGEIVDFGDDYFNTEFWCRVKPETVGQFTGLIGMDGKEIYGGDILICSDNKFHVVKFEKGLYDAKSIMDSAMDNILSFEYKESIVFGNIHDNPELLKP